MSTETTTRLLPTRNALPEEARHEIVALLNGCLAEAIDLGRHAKQAHWNVRGSSFAMLHKLFDEIAEDVDEYGDLIAERIVQLGGIADGTAQTVAEMSGLSPYPLNPISQEDHLSILAGSLAAFGRRIGATIGRAARIEDADTADIATEISRGIDKWLWQVEAHGAAPH
jgi:starvation-inducible DNA-binding protein